MIKKSPSTWLCEKDYVWVINRTYGGTFIVEGKAAVLKVLGEDRALVCFDNGDKVERFVEKAAQRDPYAFVAELNTRNPDTPDNNALTQIQSLLSGAEWTSDTLDEIAEILRSTGREVRDVLEEDND